MPFDRLTVFWIAIGVALLLFLAGLGIKVAFWSQGNLRDQRGRRVTQRKAWVVFTLAAQSALQRLGAAVSYLVLDGLLHRRLLQENRYRWVCHFLLLAGFFSLFALSIFTGFFEEILHQFLRLDTPLVRFVINKDTPLMAVLNESLGLLILAGLLLTLIRRYIQRPAQLRTTTFDTSTLVLLAIIMLTSYPLEAMRLLMERVPPAAAWYSFIGYPLSLAMQPLNLRWELWHYWTFMVHIAACIALLISMPFSKFFHVLIGPIIATANQLAGRREVRS